MATLSKSLLNVVACAGGLLLLAGCGGNVPAPTSYTNYNAKDGSFSCDCPEGWNCQGGGKQTQWVKCKSGGATVEIKTSILGSMMGELAEARNNEFGPGPIDDSMTPVAKVHDSRKEAFAEDYKNYEEQPATTVKSNRGDVRVSEFTASGPLGGKIHGYRATALGHDVSVHIACTCSESNWPTLQPAYDHVIASLGRGQRTR